MKKSHTYYCFAALILCVGALGSGTHVARSAAAGGFADPKPVTVDPFSPWLGRWKGEFVAYTAQGEVKYRIAVEQRYKAAGPGQQSAVFTNRMADGSVETVHAVNLVRAGRLICRTRRIDPTGQAVGERVEHSGTQVGLGHIIWHRRIGKRGFETFNERVEGDTYRIHGAAVYGDDPSQVELFEGRYVRVAD